MHAPYYTILHMSHLVFMTGFQHLYLSLVKNETKMPIDTTCSALLVHPLALALALLSARLLSLQSEFLRFFLVGHVTYVVKILKCLNYNITKVNKFLDYIVVEFTIQNEVGCVCALHPSVMKMKLN
jgi:hypothetical protein